MVSRKHKRKHRYSRKTNKKYRNRSLKKERIARKTRKNRMKYVMKGGSLVGSFTLNGRNYELHLNDAVHNREDITSQLNKGILEAHNQIRNVLRSTEIEKLINSNARPEDIKEEIMRKLITEKNEGWQYLSGLIIIKEPERADPDSAAAGPRNVAQPSSADGRGRDAAANSSESESGDNGSVGFRLGDISRVLKDDTYEPSIGTCSVGAGPHLLAKHHSYRKGYQPECLALGDKVHDFIASSNLTYDAGISYNLLLKCTAAIGSDAQLGDLSGTFEDRIQQLSEMVDRVLTINPHEYIAEKMGERNIMSQNIGKQLEHQFIKGLYSMVAHDTDAQRRLCVNPLLTAREAVESTRIKEWKELEQKSSEGSLLALGESPHIRGRGKEIWKLFLGRGNNIMKRNPRYNFVLNYIPLSGTSLNLNTDDDVNKALEYFLNYMRLMTNPHIYGSLLNYDNAFDRYGEMDIPESYAILLRNNLPLYMYNLYNKLIRNNREGDAKHMLQAYVNVVACNPESVTSIKRHHNSFVITDAYKSLRKALPALFFEANVSDEFGRGLTTAFELDTTAQRRDESSAYISKPVEPDDIGSVDTLQYVGGGDNIPFANAVKLPICVTHLLSASGASSNRSLIIRQYDPVQEAARGLDLMAQFTNLGTLYSKLLDSFRKYIATIRSGRETERWFSQSRDIIKLKLNFFILYLLADGLRDPALFTDIESNLDLVREKFKGHSMDWMSEFFATQSKARDMAKPKWLLKHTVQSGEEKEREEEWFPDNDENIKTSPFYTVRQSSGKLEQTMPDFFSDDKYFCKVVTGPLPRISSRKQKKITAIPKEQKSYREIFLDDLLNYDFIVSDDKLDLITDLFYSWIDLHYFKGPPVEDDAGNLASEPVFTIPPAAALAEYNVLTLKGKWFKIGDNYKQIKRVNDLGRVKIFAKYFDRDAAGNKKQFCQEYLVRTVAPPEGGDEKVLYIYRHVATRKLLFSLNRLSNTSYTERDFAPVSFYQGQYDDSAESGWIHRNMRFTNLNTDDVDMDGDAADALQQDAGEYFKINIPAVKEARRSILTNMLSNRTCKLLLRLFLYDFEAVDGALTRTTGMPISLGGSPSSFVQTIFIDGARRPEREKKPHEVIVYKNNEVVIHHILAEGPSVSNVINELRRFAICISIRMRIINEGRAKLFLSEQIMKGLFVKNRAGNDDDDDAADDKSSGKVQKVINSLFKNLMVHLDRNPDVNIVDAKDLAGKLRQLYDNCKNAEINRLCDALMNPDIGTRENIYVIMGLIIQHKTSADELQIHSLKILIDLFPVLQNQPTILSQLYFLTFDQICGIIALYYGVPLFLQKGNGVAIGFRGKTCSPGGGGGGGDESVCVFEKKNPSADEALTVQRLTNWWDYHITPSLVSQEYMQKLDHRETILRDIVFMYQRAQKLLNYKIVARQAASSSGGDNSGGASKEGSITMQVSPEDYSYHHLLKIYKECREIGGDYAWCISQIKELCNSEEEDESDDLRARIDFWNYNRDIEWLKRTNTSPSSASSQSPSRSGNGEDDATRSTAPKRKIPFLPREMVNGNRSTNTCIRARNSIKCFLFFLGEFQKNITGMEAWIRAQDQGVQTFIEGLDENLLLTMGTAIDGMLFDLKIDDDHLKRDYFIQFMNIMETVDLLLDKCSNLKIKITTIDAKDFFQANMIPLSDDKVSLIDFITYKMNRLVKLLKRFGSIEQDLTDYKEKNLAVCIKDIYDNERRVMDLLSHSSSEFSYLVAKEVGYDITWQDNLNRMVEERQNKFNTTHNGKVDKILTERERAVSKIHDIYRQIDMICGRETDILKRNLEGCKEALAESKKNVEDCEEDIERYNEALGQRNLELEKCHAELEQCQEKIKTLQSQLSVVKKQEASWREKANLKRKSETPTRQLEQDMWDDAAADAAAAEEM